MRFEKSGKINNFLEFEYIFYIVLEYLDKIDNEEKNNENKEKNNENDNTQKSTKVYIIKLEDNSEISIGNNKGNIINDINIQDDYISRSHAVIKFTKENGNLILENRSHFKLIYNKEDGTLIKKQNAKIENINEEKIEKLEIPRTFILIKDNFKLKGNKINILVANCYITLKLNKK